MKSVATYLLRLRTVSVAIITVQALFYDKSGQRLKVYLPVQIVDYITCCIFFVCRINNNLYVIGSATGLTSRSLNLPPCKSA
jgi:hypothetical protein